MSCRAADPSPSAPLRPDLLRRLPLDQLELAWKQDGDLTDALLQASRYPEADAPFELVLAPLRAEGRSLGLVVFARPFTVYSAIEQHLVRDLAWRLAQAVDAGRLSQEVGRLEATLDRRVRHRTRNLEEANRELEAFSYSVTHHLRAPIRHTLGFTQLLERHAGLGAAGVEAPQTPHLDETSLRYLQIIRSSAEQAASLVDDLLVYARMGRGDLRRTRVDLDATVRQLVSELRGECGDREVRWEFHRLPVVSADPSLLRPALRNLLSNALKFTRPREMATIVVSVEADEQETVLCVRDNGVGFDSRYGDKLFGVFQRLHPAEQFEGNGVGLANVRRVIERHGGRTWAEGETEQGAAFYLSLPHEPPEE